MKYDQAFESIHNKARVRLPGGRVISIPVRLVEQFRRLLCYRSAHSLRQDRTGTVLDLENGAVVWLERVWGRGEIIYDLSKESLRVIEPPTRLDIPPFFTDVRNDPSFAGVVEVYDRNVIHHVPDMSGHAVSWQLGDVHQGTATLFTEKLFRQIAEVIMDTDEHHIRLGVEQTDPGVWLIRHKGSRETPIIGKRNNARLIAPPLRVHSKYDWESLGMNAPREITGVKMQALRGSLMSWMRVRGLSWRVRMHYLGDPDDRKIEVVRVA